LARAINEWRKHGTVRNLPRGEQPANIAVNIHSEGKRVRVCAVPSSIRQQKAGEEKESGEERRSDRRGDLIDCCCYHDRIADLAFPL
ncbi:hypothetical protein ATANTOWER_027976, partial [Ataeniobius toweri]|nr:hypothetical protein [Ataeniobius toweri]